MKKCFGVALGLLLVFSVVAEAQTGNGDRLREMWSSMSVDQKEWLVGGALSGLAAAESYIERFPPVLTEIEGRGGRFADPAGDFVLQQIHEAWKVLQATPPNVIIAYMDAYIADPKKEHRSVAGVLINVASTLELENESHGKQAP